MGVSARSSSHTCPRVKSGAYEPSISYSDPGTPLITATEVTPSPAQCQRAQPRLRLVSAGMAGAHPIGAHWDAASNQRRTSHSAGQHSGSTVLGLRPPQFLSSPPPDLFHNRQEDEWCDPWVTVGSSVVYFYCYLYLS